MVTIQKIHHSSEPCEDQHKYICQRPAAALEGSDALGKCPSLQTHKNTVLGFNV